MNAMARLVSALFALACALPAAAQERGDGYPRLLGMNIGAKHYDAPEYQRQLARLDIAVLGFHPRWRGDRDGSKMRAVVQALKRHNPALVVAQYTVLNEAGDDRVKHAANADRIDKLDREGWWLRSRDGRKLQWTAAYGAWDINITEWARPDADGDRYPEWLAKRYARLFFDRVPEFDAWYFDNVMVRPRVPPANWRLDGRDVANTDDEVQRAFRRAMAAHWSAAAKAHPDKLLIGNPDNDLSAPEYRGRLHGAFLEGLMGKSWSIERSGGWGAMMERYRGVRANLKAPAIIGFNVWGRADDYRFFRYAFASCLLDEGYFSFTDEQRGYSAVPWFDEYDVRIGSAVEPPPAAPWTNGVYRRLYEHAMVLVNPHAQPRTVAVGPGWRRLRGAQAPDVNSGETATSVTLAPRDGLLLVKDS